MLDWIEDDYLRDLERLEKYESDNTYSCMYYWQAFGRIGVYRKLLKFDVCTAIEQKWEKLKKISPVLRWNTKYCPTLRLTDNSEHCCYSCISHIEDPEVDTCTKFGLTHGMDDPDNLDFGCLCVCDFYKENT